MESDNNNDKTLHYDNNEAKEIKNTESPKEYMKLYEESKVKKMLLKRTIGTVLISASVVFVCLSVIFAIIVINVYNPLYLRNKSAIVFSNDEETIKSADKLNQIIYLLRNNYYTEISDAEILEAMAKGLPAAVGNPYTYYLDKEMYDITKESMSGNYVGIGCSVTRTEQGLTQIVEVYPDSPAQEAGLLSKDIFVSVDGINVEVTNDTNEVAALVRGEEGTKVVIEIFRQSTGETLEFSIERKNIQQVNVTGRMLEDNIGYIHIKGFVEGVDLDFIETMEELKSLGAENIIFDLRYNSGGGANIMINMLEYLLPPGKVLATIKGRDEGEEFEVNWTTRNEAQVPEEMRYAILTNSYSASASEFFSGCLRDYGKAVIIGETTFGKGSGTSTYELPDGSAVNITVFKYYLPGGEIVEGQGLEPDIEAFLPDEYKDVSIEVIPEDEDTVLAVAIEEIRKK